MFKNKLKKIIVSAIVIASITGSIGVNAATAKFQYAYVDSNEFSKVTSCSKVTNKNAIQVSLHDIYKADGSTSNYKKIKARFRSKGINVLDNKDEVTLIKNGVNKYKIKPIYRTPSVVINFRAMGNDPSLDCQISGLFDVDTNL